MPTDTPLCPECGLIAPAGLYHDVCSRADHCGCAYSRGRADANARAQIAHLRAENERLQRALDHYKGIEDARTPMRLRKDDV